MSSMSPIEPDLVVEAYKKDVEDFGVARAKARRALPVFDCVEA